MVRSLFDIDIDIDIDIDVDFPMFSRWSVTVSLQCSRRSAYVPWETVAGFDIRPLGATNFLSVPGTS